MASTFKSGMRGRWGWAVAERAFTLTWLLFDWVIGSPDVAVKVLEGKYDDREQGKPTTGVGGFYEPWICPHDPRCSHRAACAIVALRTA